MSMTKREYVRNVTGRTQTGTAATSYRADIDGLRAISVILVVLYHVFPATIRGGFVGVDVFFVISGFLITGIINTEIRDRCFSLAGFYGRRIRHISPALALVLIAVLT
jgi:peptidoglycan/LPS O-acetylase OafA/YrhL